MRPSLFALLFLALPCVAFAAKPPVKPTDASMRRAWERNAHTVVEVSRKDGRRGAGVIVGADGHVATSTHNVDLYEATVHLDGRAITATVLSANARTRVAILKLPLENGELLRAPEAKIDAALVRSSWLVGIQPASGRAGPNSTKHANANASHAKGAEPATAKNATTRPSAGRILQGVTHPRPHFLTELSLPPGSPLFDERGRLVAIVVERAGKHGSLAIPLDRVHAQALEGAAP